MFSVIKKLFSNKVDVPPPFDYSPLIEQLLSRLQRCSREVIAITPGYGNLAFKCDVYVSALDLLQQAEDNEKGVWSSCSEEQAARLALPVWLRSADLNDSRPSTLHPDFQDLVNQYPWAIIDMPSARVFCRNCDKFLENVEKSIVDEKSLGGWRWWTDIWTCPAGHQLRYEENEVHFVMRRD